MTAQISDQVLYDTQAGKKRFTLVGVDGSGLFRPEDWGVRPVSFHTACVRGFHCTYEVLDGLLVLKKLNIRFDQETMAAIAQGKGPRIFGKVPRTYKIHVVGWDVRTEQEFEEDQIAPDCILDRLREVMHFTGGILIGSGLLGNLYVHMGFQKACRFKVVHELIFDGGKLVKASDRSTEMAAVRRQFQDRPQQLGPQASRDEGVKWVLKCFDLSYNSTD